MAVVQSTPGVGTFSFGPEISTELATTAFGLAAGLFGGVAGLVASQRLKQLPETVPAGILAIPVAVAGISTVAGALLLPTEV